MKRILTAFVFCLAACASFAQAKYVFVFIGDGMGMNEINFTQHYLGSVSGKDEIAPLTMTGFSVCNVANTYSLNNGVTDSAASGTAIACGQKTNNSMLGINPDGTKYQSIAELAAQNGKKVGILTNVGANHATPAAFFGHNKNRGAYDELITDMLADKFDVYAGSELMRSKEKDRIYGSHPEEEFVKAGYTLIGNNEQFASEYKNAGKILFIPDSGHHCDIAIDRPVHKRQAITLADMVGNTIDFFMKEKNKGFFIMAEGGHIDHVAHANDAAGTVQEIIDFDNAVKIAYEFYLQHPKETAILVTADHDTGGCGLNLRKFSDVKNLQYQKYSSSTLTNMLKSDMEKKGAEPLTWDEVKAFLKENLGFWDTVRISKDNEAILKGIYDKTIATGETGNVTDSFGYNHNAEIVSKAVLMLDEICGLVWTTRGHSGAYVPVFYIGPKPELFSVRLDNTSFFNKIKQVAKYK